MKQIHRKIVDTINAADSILIVSHMDPDGDSIGSQLAMSAYVKSLGKKCRVLYDGIIPSKYSFFPRISEAINISDYREIIEYDLIIYLECPIKDRTGKVIKVVNDSAIIINIDHHPDNSGYGDAVHLDPKASSVGELLTIFFTDIGYEIDRDTATVLYAAILTDTGRFRYESTSQATMEAAGILIGCGVNPRQVTDNIYYSMPESLLRLTGKALNQMEFHRNGRICLIALDSETVNGTDMNPSDTEGMAEFILYGENAIVGAFIKEIRPSFTKISLRSRDTIDVSQLAHKYGGGGHFNASGFTVEKPINDAKEMILNELKELVGAAV